MYIRDLFCNILRKHFKSTTLFYCMTLSVRNTLLVKLIILPNPSFTVKYPWFIFQIMQISV